MGNRPQQSLVKLQNVCKERETLNKAHNLLKNSYHTHWDKSSLTTPWTYLSLPFSPGYILGSQYNLRLCLSYPAAQKANNLVKYSVQKDHMSSGKGKAETNRKTVLDLMGMELRNKSVFNLFSAEHFQTKNPWKLSSQSHCTVSLNACTENVMLQWFTPSAVHNCKVSL